MNAITYYFPAQAHWIFGALIVVGVVLAALLLADVVRNFLRDEEAEQ